MAICPHGRFKRHAGTCRCSSRESGTDERETFRSAILPPYLRKTPSVAALYPWLYLKGISPGDFGEALQALLGPEARGLSATTITRLKAVWEQEYQDWSKRSLAHRSYAYVWADGVYFNVRLEDTDNKRQCILVLMGATRDGTKELIAITDGYRESEQSWRELLLDVRHRGLTIDPELAIGDGGIGGWVGYFRLATVTDPFDKHAIRVPRVRILPSASFRSHLTMGTLSVRLGVPVIKASKGLAPSSHFPVGFRLPVDSARQGAARHAWRTSGRPGSLLTLAPHRSGRAGSAASGSSTDSFATRRRVPAGPGSQAMATAIPKACLASLAIRCRDVETGPNLGVLAVFPSNGAPCRCCQVNEFGAICGRVNQRSGCCHRGPHCESSGSQQSMMDRPQPMTSHSKQISE